MLPTQAFGTECGMLCTGCLNYYKENKADLVNQAKANSQECQDGYGCSWMPLIMAGVLGAVGLILVLFVVTFEVYRSKPNALPAFITNFYDASFDNAPAAGGAGQGRVVEKVVTVTNVAFTR